MDKPSCQLQSDPIRFTTEKYVLGASSERVSRRLFSMLMMQVPGAAADRVADYHRRDHAGAYATSTVMTAPSPEVLLRRTQ